MDRNRNKRQKHEKTYKKMAKNKKAEKLNVE